MADVEHTYVDTNNGLGGPALGAGFQDIVNQLKTTTTTAG